jgi:hypothetical protein
MGSGGLTSAQTAIVVIFGGAIVITVCVVVLAVCFRRNARIAASAVNRQREVQVTTMGEGPGDIPISVVKIGMISIDDSQDEFDPSIELERTRNDSILQKPNPANLGS